MSLRQREIGEGGCLDLRSPCQRAARDVQTVVSTRKPELGTEVGHGH